MCIQCVVESVHYGEVMPGWHIHRATKHDEEWPQNHWGLVRCNNPDFIWESEPMLDPYHGLSDDEINMQTLAGNPLFKEWDKRSDEFRDALFCDPKTGHQLVEDAKAAGYTEADGNLSDWLFHRMGRVIRARALDNK